MNVKMFMMKFNGLLKETIRRVHTHTHTLLYQTFIMKRLSKQEL